MDQFLKEFHVDFAVVLSAATILTGIVWLLDKVWLGPRRRGRLVSGEDKPGAIVDFSRSFFPIILAVLVLRSFIVEPFRIPSGSMMPTLVEGDFILVNKWAYGLRVPVGFWKFVEVGAPQRGDVVVFRYPDNPSQDYIKRMVGLPGDHIAWRDKVLYVNGAPMQLDADGVYTAPGRVAERYIEHLGEVRHQIIIDPSTPSYDRDWIVPQGHFFVMGDNRDGSSDSRSWGFVPEHNLVGRAFYIWMHWKWGHLPDWSRFGQSIT